MTLLRTLLLAAALSAGFTSAPALGQQPRQQGEHKGQARESDRAFDAAREGRSMPLPQLKRRVMPFVGPNAEDIGPEMNGQSYRFKFIQNGRVIWVDVDPQTGRIIRRSNPQK